MERIPYIDGIRGYLIYSMTLSHLGVLGANGLWWASHKSVSIFFTGEGFMAISGLMMGYITLRAVTEKGIAKSLFGSLRRSWKILRYYLAVYVLCLLPMVLFELSSNDTLFTFFRERNPVTSGALGLFLTGIYRPLMFDILYLYIILIGLSPLVVFVALRLGAPWVLGASIALWLAVQYGLVEKVNARLADVLNGDPVLLFGSFPIFAWQLPFVLGVLLGMEVARRYTEWPVLLTWIRQNLMTWALTLCLAFALFRWIDMFGLARIGAGFFQNYLALAPLTLLNFFAFCIVITTILHSNREEPNAFIRLAKRGLDPILNSKILTTIGSNTLLTFSASVVITYWLIPAQPVLETLGPPWFVNALAFVVVILVLYLIVLADRAIRKAIKSRLNPR